MPENKTLSFERVLTGANVAIFMIYAVGTLLWALVGFDRSNLVCNFFDSVRQCNSATEYWQTRAFWIVFGLFPLTIVVAIGNAVLLVLGLIFRSVFSK